MRITGGRPSDEARFQIKFGSKRGNDLHELFHDECNLWLTLLCGVDVEHSLIVSADPLAHSPTRFFVSVEYKQRHMSAIQADGWTTWTRDRRARDKWSRPIPDEQAATTETLVGASERHVLDLVLFERAAVGLTPEYRQVLAETWLQRKTPHSHATEHELLNLLGLNVIETLDMIRGAPRLQMAVRGWAAEEHLSRFFMTLPVVEKAEKIPGDGSQTFGSR